jgi:hypothetical protein
MGVKNGQAIVNVLEKFVFSYVASGYAAREHPHGQGTYIKEDKEMRIYEPKTLNIGIL